MTTNPLDLAAASVPAVPDGGGVGLGLQVVLGKVASASERVAAALDQAAQRKQILPVPYAITQVATIPNPAATFTIMMGGPTQGRQWTIRKWSVGDGNDVTTVIAGTDRADLYVGKPYGTNGTTGAINQWIDTMGNPPGLQHISNGEIIVYPQDKVFIVCTGMTTAGQQIAGCLWILDEVQASFTAVQEI